jgi:hypothetical protein
MKRTCLLILFALLLTNCALPTLTGPSNLYDAPRTGWTMAEVRAHWGIPWSSSYYGNAETWLYRRSYMVMGAYGNHIEAEYASVSFYDGRVVGVSY